MVGEALYRRVVVHPAVVRVQRRNEGGRVGAQSGQAVSLGQRPEVPAAVFALRAPGRVCAAAAAGREEGVHVGHEAAETRAVLLRGGRGGRLGLRGSRGSVQAGRRGAQEAGGVGQLVRDVVRLDDGGRRAVGAVHVRSPLSLPPEVAIVEHLLAVGVQRPVVTFT